MGLEDHQQKTLTWGYTTTPLFTPLLTKSLCGHSVQFEWTPLSRHLTIICHLLSASAMSSVQVIDNICIICIICPSYNIVYYANLFIFLSIVHLDSMYSCSALIYTCIEWYQQIAKTLISYMHH